LAEWSIAAVLKTVVPRGTGGSNPSLSAKTYNPHSALLNGDFSFKKVSNLFEDFLNEKDQKQKRQLCFEDYKF
jgi:hypothetical protein